MKAVIVGDVLSVIPCSEKEDGLLSSFFKNETQDWDVCPKFDEMTNLHTLTIRKEKTYE